MLSFYCTPIGTGALCTGTQSYLDSKIADTCGITGSKTTPSFESMPLPTMPASNVGQGMPNSASFDQGTDTLWVFLLELLSAPQTYGHIICWTDYSQAEFKLYKPAEVATLWGRRKNRPAMNYDKLSRSLRYYYKKNILRKVPGRKYVYQFCRLDQLLASLNPLNSPIASAYCQIFSQHLVANLYNPHTAVSSQQSLPGPFPSQQPMMPLRPSVSMPSSLHLQSTMPQAQCKTECYSPVRSSIHSNTPVSIKTEGFRSRQLNTAQSKVMQPLTPSDDEASLSEDDGNDIDVEDSSTVADRYDATNPAFHVSPQTAFATYAALDGNSQPESIITRNQTPPISQITPSASGSEGRTPSSAGEPPAKQSNLETSSSSVSTSSPAIGRSSAAESAIHRVDQPIARTNPASSHIAERRPVKRKPEPLKFAFSAANLATSAASSSNDVEQKTSQHFAFLNTLNSLQSALSPFNQKPFSLFNPLSASLATPQTTDWLKLTSPRPDAPGAQPVSTFTFPPPLTQFAPLGLPAPLPSPMITTPIADNNGGLSVFNFPSLVPSSANMQSLIAAAHIANSMVNSTNNQTTTSSSSKASTEG